MRPSFRPVRISAPAEAPVTLAEAKAHLRIDHDGDDVLIGSLIAVAVEHIDGWSGILGRCLVTQTWRQDFDGIGHCLRLPMPALALTSVSYIGGDGSTVTLDSADAGLYHDALGSFISVLHNRPLPGLADVVAPVTIVADYGYGSANDVPSPIKAAILLEVGRLFGMARSDVGVKKDVVEGVGSKEWDVSGIIDVQFSGAAANLLAPYRRVSL